LSEQAIRVPEASLAEIAADGHENLGELRIVGPDADRPFEGPELKLPPERSDLDLEDGRRALSGNVHDRAGTVGRGLLESNKGRRGIDLDPEVFPAIFVDVERFGPSLQRVWVLFDLPQTDLPQIKFGRAYLDLIPEKGEHRNGDGLPLVSAEGDPSEPQARRT